MTATWNRCRRCRRRSERASTHDDHLCLPCSNEDLYIPCFNDALELVFQPLSAIDNIPSQLAIEGWSRFYRFCFGFDPSPERLAAAKANLGKGWDSWEDDL